MSATSARTLLWTAGILAILGGMIGAPAAGVLMLALGALLAAVAAVLRSSRTRIIAGVLVLACLSLAAARLSEARRELALYRAAAARTAR